MEKFTSRREQEQPMKRKINFYRILCAVLAVALVAVVIVMIYRNYTQNRAGQIYSDLQEQVNTPRVEVDTQQDTEGSDTENGEEDTEIQDTDPWAALGITIPEKNINWDTMHETNEEIYAWIYIPETNIDYPVLQNAGEDEYYLMHNLDGSYGYPGCIFTQMLNQKDFQDYNTVMYGHNMKDGTMFRTLHYYQNEEFFYNNPYIYVYTEDDVRVYRIFAAYNAGDEHILNTYDFSTEEGFANYLSFVQSKAPEDGYIRSSVEVTVQNHILTLSTCTDAEDERYLVQGVLLNDELEQDEETPQDTETGHDAETE
jgi:sortase B